MSRTIVEELGLTSAAHADELALGTRAFAPVHVGMHDVRIGALLELVHRHDWLLPPRTGHVGNWQDIVLGRAGPMDFNTGVCAGGHGYPLIYGFTRTEADAEGGDVGYLPGSLVEGGRRRLLPLFTWNGTRFVVRDRAAPLFCPLVQTALDGELLPLVDVHWQRLPAVDGFRFRNWACSLLDNETLLVEMLCVLLAEAAASESPRRSLADLISHAVGLDGDIGRRELRPDAGGYVLGDYRYSSASELAEAVVLLLRSLTEPAWFFSQLRSLPPVLPVPSLLLTNVLFGLFGDHRPEERGIPQERPYITHLHWGARAMAGCPPRRSGYFARRSRVSAMRAIMNVLVREFADVPPVCFVLLPAQVFMLCPRSTCAGDIDAMEKVVAMVLAAAPDGAHERALSAVAAHADVWSPYLRGRFRGMSGIPCDGESLPPARPVEPEGFRELTFRQASAIVAAFEEVYGS
jgi:hypothetical protein